MTFEWLDEHEILRKIKKTKNKSLDFELKYNITPLSNNEN